MHEATQVALLARNDMIVTGGHPAASPSQSGRQSFAQGVPSIVEGRGQNPHWEPHNGLSYDGPRFARGPAMERSW